ncbi:MAG TPA: energy transducer TonB [Anaeromyxobacteraceae bacterium]|jgi:TonB family protein|nr:energy transducer TonB [Anaeromyxobacteraceae bacterium]
MEHAATPLLLRRERLGPVLLLSLAVHAGLIAWALWHRPAPVLDVRRQVIAAKLVRRGPERPKNLMPRKPQETAAAPSPAPPGPAPAPAPAAPRAPAPAPKVAAAPAPASHPAPLAKPLAKSPPPRVAQAAPPPRAAASRAAGGNIGGVLDKMRRGLIQQQPEEPAWGRPDGDPAGESDTGQEGDQYLGLVDQRLHEVYHLPSTISDRDRMHLAATVVLYIQPDGRILRYAFEQRSGNSSFDDALERAVRNARLPSPPPEQKRQYQTVGLAVTFRAR